MSEIKLKPCPFCGGDAKLVTGISKSILFEDRPNATVICQKCGCRTESVADIYHDGSVINAVIRYWNRRKEGHWIDTNPDELLDPRVTCSECGNTEVLHAANFCPNCGADMGNAVDG